MSDNRQTQSRNNPTAFTIGILVLLFIVFTVLLTMFRDSIASTSGPGPSASMENGSSEAGTLAPASEPAVQAESVAEPASPEEQSAAPAATAAEATDTTEPLDAAEPVPAPTANP